MAGAGQIEADSRPGAGLGMDFNMTARLFGETVNHAQAETRTVADRPRREKRFEHPPEDLGRDPGSGVGDGQVHVLARFNPRILGHVVEIELGILQLDHQQPPVGHRVTGVECQIDERRFDLRRIGVRHPQVGGECVSRR